MKTKHTSSHLTSRRAFVKLLAATGLTMGCRAAHALGETALITRPIASTGERIPIVGLGTWQTFDVGPGGIAAVREVYSRFLDRGGRLLDTSPMYGVGVSPPPENVVHKRDKVISNRRRELSDVLAMAKGYGTYT